VLKDPLSLASFLTWSAAMARGMEEGFQVSGTLFFSCLTKPSREKSSGQSRLPWALVSGSQPQLCEFQSLRLSDQAM
jgi:hypothetical protein